MPGLKQIPEQLPLPVYFEDALEGVYQRYTRHDLKGKNLSHAEKMALVEQDEVRPAFDNVLKEEAKRRHTAFTQAMGLQIASREEGSEEKEKKEEKEENEEKKKKGKEKKGEEEDEDEEEEEDEEEDEEEEETDEKIILPALQLTTVENLRIEYDQAFKPIKNKKSTTASTENTSSSSVSLALTPVVPEIDKNKMAKVVVKAKFQALIDTSNAFFSDDEKLNELAGKIDSALRGKKIDLYEEFSQQGIYFNQKAFAELQNDLQQNKNAEEAKALFWEKQRAAQEKLLRQMQADYLASNAYMEKVKNGLGDDFTRSGDAENENFAETLLTHTKSLDNIEMTEDLVKKYGADGFEKAYGQAKKNFNASLEEEARKKMHLSMETNQDPRYMQVTTNMKDMNIARLSPESQERREFQVPGVTPPIVFWYQNGTFYVNPADLRAASPGVIKRGLLHQYSPVGVVANTYGKVKAGLTGKEQMTPEMQAIMEGKVTATELTMRAIMHVQKQGISADPDVYGQLTVTGNAEFQVEAMRGLIAAGENVNGAEQITPHFGKQIETTKDVFDTLDAHDKLNKITVIENKILSAKENEALQEEIQSKARITALEQRVDTFAEKCKTNAKRAAKLRKQSEDLIDTIETDKEQRFYNLKATLSELNARIVLTQDTLKTEGQKLKTDLKKEKTHLEEQWKVTQAAKYVTQHIPYVKGKELFYSVEDKLKACNNEFKSEAGKMLPETIAARNLLQTTAVSELNTFLPSLNRASEQEKLAAIALSVEILKSKDCGSDNKAVLIAASAKILVSMSNEQVAEIPEEQRQYLERMVNEKLAALPQAQSGSTDTNATLRESLTAAKAKLKIARPLNEDSTEDEDDEKLSQNNNPGSSSGIQNNNSK